MSEQNGGRGLEGVGESGNSGQAELLSRLDAIQAATARLEQGQGAIDSRLQSLTDEQPKLRGDVMARIDRVQDTVTAIRDDIAFATGRADNVSKSSATARGDIDYLIAQIVILERQIQRLQNDVREIKGENQ